MNMHLTTLAILLAGLPLSRTAFGMSAAGLVIFVIGVMAAKNDLIQARGLDKIVALANLCFAAPLVVFGAEHFLEWQSIMQLVPAFMPWHLFWTYFVGVALIAAGLSIATKIQVRWSGLFFGIMMFTFVAMMDLPVARANIRDRFFWALLLREPSFGSAGWIFAGAAMGGNKPGKILINIGRVVIGIAAMFYGVEHFLHPLNVPGVPLEKLMPTWIPARMPISYLTGVFLLIAGAAILFNRKTRTAATYLGTWILLIVLFVYGPILIASLMDPSPAVQIEGLNYFFDTLLFDGAILAIASAMPKSA
jgi:uncharacterized membrane protein